jgi:glycosyltransferase involved in cell wall biosynthesis
MISVIIPAYIPTRKHHDLFLRALASLENQVFKKFEVLCVLNGCYTDYDTIIDSAQKFNLDIRFLALEGKASGAIARNFGIKNATHSLIAQLDVDDQYHPEKLSKQIDFFDRNPGYDFVGTLAYCYHEPDRIEDSGFMPGQYMTHNQISDVINVENIMCHGSVVFRKDSFNELGGYNEKNKPGDVWPELGIRMWEDWDLWQRAIKNGMKFYNLPERLYYWSVNTGVER